MNALGRVVLLSLEPWDEVWRRNEYFAVELVRQGLVRQLDFVEPALPGSGREFSPVPGIVVHRPPLLLPRRIGGLRQLAVWLLPRVRRADLVWVNDAALGARCLPVARRAVYDVTDDWRSIDQPQRMRRRLVRAEDRLTGRARVVVCSVELRARWVERYGVEPAVVHNGADLEAFAAAARRSLDGSCPQVGYVGTLHSARLDVPAVVALAATAVTVHLVGPDHLEATDRDRLVAAGVRLHRAVPAADVPSWLISFDVLICPHRVTAFTLSLDAIKSYEYLAARRPVVATATSGFQHLTGTKGVRVCQAEEFPAAVGAALAAGEVTEPDPASGWPERAREFAAVLQEALMRVASV